MKTPALTTAAHAATAGRTSKADWLIPASLVALSLVPSIAGCVRLAQLAGGATVTADNARFFASPLPVVLHIISVVIFSLLGAFQFSAGFRRRYRSWHRAAGRILIPAGIVAACSGLWMAQFYPSPPNDGQLVYAERVLAGTWMLVAIAMSLRAIRARKFALHGDWMLRAYAIGLGAGTQVFTHVPWFVFADVPPGKLPRAVMMGAGWVINAVIAELIIRRSRSFAYAGGGAALGRPAIRSGATGTVYWKTPRPLAGK